MTCDLPDPGMPVRRTSLFPWVMPAIASLWSSPSPSTSPTDTSGEDSHLVFANVTRFSSVSWMRLDIIHFPSSDVHVLSPLRITPSTTSPFDGGFLRLHAAISASYISPAQYGTNTRFIFVSYSEAYFARTFASSGRAGASNMEEWICSATMYLRSGSWPLSATVKRTADLWPTPSISQRNL